MTNPWDNDPIVNIPSPISPQIDKPWENDPIKQDPLTQDQPQFTPQTARAIIGAGGNVPAINGGEVDKYPHLAEEKEIPKSPFLPMPEPEIKHKPISDYIMPINLPVNQKTVTPISKLLTKQDYDKYNNQNLKPTQPMSGDELNKFREEQKGAVDKEIFDKQLKGSIAHKLGKDASSLSKTDIDQELARAHLEAYNKALDAKIANTVHPTDNMLKSRATRPSSFMVTDAQYIDPEVDKEIVDEHTLNAKLMEAGMRRQFQRQTEEDTKLLNSVDKTIYNTTVGLALSKAEEEAKAQSAVKNISQGFALSVAQLPLSLIGLFDSNDANQKQLGLSLLLPGSNTAAGQFGSGVGTGLSLFAGGELLPAKVLLPVFAAMGAGDARIIANELRNNGVEISTGQEASAAVGLAALNAFGGFVLHKSFGGAKDLSTIALDKLKISQIELPNIVKAIVNKDQGNLAQSLLKAYVKDIDKTLPKSFYEGMAYQIASNTIKASTGLQKWEQMGDGVIGSGVLLGTVSTAGKVFLAKSMEPLIRTASKNIVDFYKLHNKIEASQVNKPISNKILEEVTAYRSKDIQGNGEEVIQKLYPNLPKEEVNKIAQAVRDNPEFKQLLTAMDTITPKDMQEKIANLEKGKDLPLSPEEEEDIRKQALSELTNERQEEFNNIINIKISNFIGREGDKYSGRDNKQIFESMLKARLSDDILKNISDKNFNLDNLKKYIEPSTWQKVAPELENDYARAEKIANEFSDELDKVITDFSKKQRMNGDLLEEKQDKEIDWDKIKEEPKKEEPKKEEPKKGDQPQPNVDIEKIRKILNPKQEPTNPELTKKEESTEIIPEGKIKVPPGIGGSEYNGRSILIDADLKIPAFGGINVDLRSATDLFNEVRDIKNDSNRTAGENIALHNEALAQFESSLATSYGGETSAAKIMREIEKQTKASKIAQTQAVVTQQTQSAQKSDKTMSKERTPTGRRKNVDIKEFEGRQKEGLLRAKIERRTNKIELTTEQNKNINELNKLFTEKVPAEYGKKKDISSLLSKSPKESVPEIGTTFDSKIGDHKIIIGETNLGAMKDTNGNTIIDPKVFESGLKKGLTVRQIIDTLDGHETDEKRLIDLGWGYPEAHDAVNKKGLEKLMAKKSGSDVNTINEAIKPGLEEAAKTSPAPKEGEAIPGHVEEGKKIEEKKDNEELKQLVKETGYSEEEIIKAQKSAEKLGKPYLWEEFANGFSGGWNEKEMIDAIKEAIKTNKKTGERNYNKDNYSEGDFAEYLKINKEEQDKNKIFTKEGEAIPGHVEEGKKIEEKKDNEEFASFWESKPKETKKLIKILGLDVKDKESLNKAKDIEIGIRKYAKDTGVPAVDVNSQIEGLIRSRNIDIKKVDAFEKIKNIIDKNQLSDNEKKAIDILRKIKYGEEYTGIDYVDKKTIKELKNLGLSDKKIEHFAGITSNEEYHKGVLRTHLDIERRNKEEQDKNKIFTKEGYEKTKKNLQSKLGPNKMNVGIDPTILLDLIKMGGYHIEKGIRDFASWSKQMISQFGEGVKPYLDHIWEQVKPKEVKPKTGQQLLEEVGMKPPTEEEMVIPTQEGKPVTLTGKEKLNVNKILDIVAKNINAGRLTHLTTAIKIPTASVSEIGLAPIREAAGFGLSKLLPGLWKGEPEGVSSLKIEKEAFTGTFSKQTLQAMKDTLLKGKDTLDKLYSKYNYETPNEYLSWPGRFHGLLKTPAKINAFIRSKLQQTEFYLKKGIDPSKDSDLSNRINTKAYQTANSNTWLRDNIVSDAMRNFTNYLEKPNEKGVVPVANKALATTAKVLVPFTKVSTNVIADTFNYTLGAPVGGIRAGVAYAKGIENLAPEQRTAIIRQLKMGSVGLAALLFGMFNPNSVGGFYQQNEKRKKGEAAAGKINFLGVEIPAALLHHPIFQAMMVGSTITRVFTDKGRKEDVFSAGTSAILKSATGVIENAPFVREANDVKKLMSNPSQFLSQYASDALVPGAVQDMSKWFDKDEQGKTIQRKPDNALQTLEMNIPGLRSNIKETKKYSDSKKEEVINNLSDKYKENKEVGNTAIRQSIKSNIISEDDGIRARKLSRMSELEKETEHKKIDDLLKRFDNNPDEQKELKSIIFDKWFNTKRSGYKGSDYENLKLQLKKRGIIKSLS